MFLGGEKGSDCYIDAGSFKALRDPTNEVDLRGLWESVVKFRSMGRMLLPENTKLQFKGPIDGGIRRSVLAWPHERTFVKAPRAELNEALSRDIKNMDYVTKFLPSMWLLLIDFDQVWGKSWTADPIMPRPACVVEATSAMLGSPVESALHDWLKAHGAVVPDPKQGSTLATILKSMTANSDELAAVVARKPPTMVL